MSLFGCHCSKNAATSEMTCTFERDEVWQLISLRGKEIHYTEDMPKVNLQFVPEAGTISGCSGCNQYFGKYSYSAPKLTFSNTGCTRMMCPDEQMKLEDQFLPLLNKVTSCELTNYTLTLYQGDKVVMVFEKQ